MHNSFRSLPDISSAVITPTTSKCPECNSNVTNKQRGLACAVCHHWVHLKCDASINIALYKCLVKYPADGLLYLCQKCKPMCAMHPSGSYILTDTHITQAKQLSNPISPQWTDKRAHKRRRSLNPVSTSASPKRQIVATNRGTQTDKHHPYETITCESQTDITFKTPHGAETRTTCKSTVDHQTLVSFVPQPATDTQLTLNTTKPPPLQPAPRTKRTSVVEQPLVPAPFGSARLKLANQRDTLRNSIPTAARQIPRAQTYAEVTSNYDCSDHIDTTAPTNTEPAHRINKLTQPSTDVNNHHPQPARGLQNRQTSTQPAIEDIYRMSVIVFNIPEPLSTDLAEREQHDLEHWQAICHKLNISGSEHLRIQRLTRNQHPTKIYPRLLKVTYGSSDNVEKTLLASSLSAPGLLGTVRIRADLTRSERLRRAAEAKTDAAESRQRRSIILRGIPESLDNTSTHDIQQWDYVRTKLNCTAVATSMVRLPRPAHLLYLRAPKLLRVTVASETMVEHLLESWHTQRHNLPNDIRIHRDQPRAIRQTNRAVIHSPVTTTLTISLDRLKTHNDAANEDPTELPMSEPSTFSTPTILEDEISQDNCSSHATLTDYRNCLGTLGTVNENSPGSPSKNGLLPEL